MFKSDLLLLQTLGPFTDSPGSTEPSLVNSSLDHLLNGTLMEPLPTAQSAPAGPSMLFRFICETGIALPVAVLGAVGNVLAVAVLCKQKQLQSTSVLLQSLAMADCAVLFSTLLLRSFRYLYLYTKVSWMSAYMEAYHYIFRWLYPMVYFFRLTDTWLTVLLTIDRFIAVRFPLHAQSRCTTQRTLKHLGLLLLAAFLFSVPRFGEYTIDLHSRFKFSSTELLRSQGYTIGYRIVAFFIVMYLVPMLLLVVLNAKLIVTLNKADLYRANMASRTTSSRGCVNRSITAMVVTIVLVTVVCNVSAMVSHLIWSLEQCLESFRYLEVPRRYLSNISNVFVTLNSAVNFIIYCFCSRNFRNVLYRMCRCNSNRRRFIRNSSQTRSTGIYISLTKMSASKKKSITGSAIPYLPNKLFG